MRSQLWGLYVREVLRTFRNPFVVLVTLVQPFMWLAFFGSSFNNLAAASGKFGVGTYYAFLLPGTLSTSMLGMGMFGSMSTIQDKRFGFMKRILITPTSKQTIFLSKAFGAATRGMVQVPVMVAAAVAFGVAFPLSPLDWVVWVLALLLLAVGFSAFFLAVTAPATDWQTPGVLSNFITMPLMFASASLFPSSYFPGWMQAISNVNPITFSAELGRSFLLGTSVDWLNFLYLALFAAIMLVIGYFVSARWLKVE